MRNIVKRYPHLVKFMLLMGLQKCIVTSMGMLSKLAFFNLFPLLLHKKMLQFEYITTNPKILGGKPIIKDTRISVEFILELLASGAALKDIVEAYPHLSEEAVKEAILYAVFHLRNNVFIDVPLNAA